MGSAMPLVPVSLLHAVGWIGVIVVAVFVIIGFFAREFIGGMFGFYRIVPVNEAHIRILGQKKDVFSARTGTSAYWYIPFMTKLHKLPLINLAIPVDNIKLNDKDMAKFVCDLMCFVNITNIELAAERLDLTDTDQDLGFDFVKLSLEMKAIIESIGRTVTTKQTILEVYRDRAKLNETITKEVEAVFPRWGIDLVNLEIKHLKDSEGSTIISDIERLRAAEIRRDADIKTANMAQEAAVAQAKSQEAARKQEVERDRNVQLASAKMLEEVAEATAKANIKQISAMRELEFGKAEIMRQVTEKNAEGARIKLQVEAEGMKQKLSLEAEGESSKITSIGEANADIIRKTKFAEAEGTEKMAKAMALFNDAAMGVKMLDVQKEVMIAKFQAFAQSLANADIKWIMSGANAQKFFGMNLDAEGGAQMQQFLEESGISMEKIKGLLQSELLKSSKEAKGK